MRLITHLIFGIILFSFTLFAYLYFDLPEFKLPKTKQESSVEVFLQENVNWSDVSIELTTLLTDLIQIKTVRKDELKAALYLQRIFQKEGISSRIIPHPKHSNKAAVIAEIGPEDAEGGIIFLSHLDVVEVNENDWSVPPFSAEMKDGKIYGRGTLDMKGMTTMQLMVFLLIQRYSYPLKEKLMFLAVPDEESGGEYGAKFLWEEHSELFDGYQYVINEGGFGITDFPNKGNQFFNVQTSEKGIVNAEVIAKSNSGHGSMPDRMYSSLTLMRLILELQKLQEVKFIPQVTEFFHSLAHFYNFPKNFFLKRIQNPVVQKIVKKDLQKNKATNAMITNTISITGLDTDTKSPNVIPAESRAMLDIRTLPGEDANVIISELKNLAKKYNSDVVVHKVIPASESSSETQLYEVLYMILKDNFPNAQIAPYLSPGATDSRFFREKGLACYGLIPILITMDDINKLHGIDENISLKNLTLGTKILFETIIAYNQVSEL